MIPHITIFSKKKFETLEDKSIATGFLYSYDSKSGLRKYCIDTTKIDFDLDVGNSDTIYGLMSNYRPITILPKYSINYDLDVLSSVSIETKDYIIGRRNDEKLIAHATMQTEYNEIVYSSLSLNALLKFESVADPKEYRIEWRSIEVRFKYQTYKIVNPEGSDVIKHRICFCFSEGLYLKQVREFTKYIDASINLLSAENRFSSQVELKTIDGLMYTYNYTNYLGDESSRPLLVLRLLDKERMSSKIFKSIQMIVSFNDCNMIAPLLFPPHDYDFVEQKFIRYYTALESIRAKINYNAKQEGGKHFNQLLFERYSSIVKNIMGEYDAHVLEKEIRYLRHHFLHEGFVVDGYELRVEKEKGEERYVKTINRNWIIKVTTLLKKAYYNYLLESANISDAKNITKKITNNL